MPTIKEIIERRSFFSDRISSQVRIVAISLLATTWGLLIGKVKMLDSSSEILLKDLIIVSSIAICVLFIDFMQYLFAYLNTDRLISEMDEKKLEEADYKYDNYYNLSVFFFWAKQT